MRTATRAAAALLTAALVLCALASGAQNVHYGECFELNGCLNSNQSHEYTANYFIDLNSGFHSAPNENQSTLLQTDPNGIFPPESGVTGGPNYSDTGVVGAIGGVVDVSPMGAAVYNIPIGLPKGINGMQPNISVTYNSQSGNGLLGWGWNLSGISAITRAGTTIYHDGYMSGADFDDDRFYLDGQRLMVVNGNSGGDGSEYKTEIDGMAKIISYTCDTTMGPARFEVWTANGLVLEYGGTWDSRIGLQQRNDVCLWLLNRVEDRNGNYMTYHYSRGGASYSLAHIKYTYNDALFQDPAYDVAFLYDDREDKEHVFVGNNSLRQSKLLKEINVKYDNDSILWHYCFNYDESTGLGTSDVYHRLTSIGFRCGDQTYNPTVITWNQNQNNYSTSSMMIDGQIFHYNYNPHYCTDLGGIKFTGDFNGDGYSDVVTTWDQGSQKVAYIYLNKGRWELSRADTLYIDDNVDWVYTGDFNGDGLADLLFMNRDRNTWISYYDFVTFDIYLTEKNNDGSLSFVPCSSPQSSAYWIWHTKGVSLAMGDFLGERKDTFVFQTVEENKHTYKRYHIYYDETSGGMEQDDIGGINPNAESVQAADFNGDGIAELWYYKTDPDVTEGKIIKLDQNKNFVEVNGSVLTRYHKMFPGDFNGDGKADFLSFASDGNGGGSWQINLSKAGALFWPQYDITAEMGIGDPGNHGFSIQSRTEQLWQFKMVAVADFNGDGKSDIATIKNEGLPFDSLVVLYAPFDAQGCAFRQTIPNNLTGMGTTSEYNIVYGNFLGRENVSLFYHDDLFHITPMSDRYTVANLADGMGKTASFQYGYLMPDYHDVNWDGYYMTNGILENREEGVFAVSLPIKGVRSMTENSTGCEFTTNYLYEGALVHNYGRGFLGFTKRTMTTKANSTVQKRVETWNDIQMLYPFPMLVPNCDSVFDKDGNLVSCVQYNYVPFVNNRDGRQKVFVPVMREEIVRAYDLDRHLFQKKTRLMNSYRTDISGSTNRYDNTFKTTVEWCGVTSDDNVSAQNGFEFQTIMTTEYEQDILQSWTLNRPQRVTTTKMRLGGYEDVSSCVSYTYESNNPTRVASVLTLPNSGVELDDPLAVKVEYLYDCFGHVTTETIKAPYDNNLSDRVTTYQYNSDYGYRFLTGKTLPLGYTTSYAYDEYYGHIVSETDCNGRTVGYERDPLGTTVWTHYPNGTTSCLATRWNGNSGYYTWEKTSGESAFRNYYDRNGRIKGTASVGVNDRIIRTAAEFDSFGRVCEESLPYYEGDTVLWIKYFYDDYNRLIRITRPDGTMEMTEYDGLTTNHVMESANGATHETASCSNVMGWTVSSSEKLEGESENTVTYGYYADGALAWAEVNGQIGMRDSLRYDHNRNRVYLRDPDYGITNSAFNAFGELVSEADPKGYTTVNAYDLLGRTTSRTVTDGNSTIESTVWTFDETTGHKGLLSTVVHDNQTVSYSYDDQLRLARIINSIDNVDYVSGYTYDDISRLLTETYPSGLSVRYGYKTNGHLRDITDISSGKRLWMVGDANASGQLTEVRLGNGVQTEYSYDILTGHLKETRSFRRGNGATVQHFSYDYDGFGNLVNRTDCRLNNGNGIAESFTYDRLNRLVTVSLNGIQAGQTQYDVYGRITSKSADGQFVFSTSSNSYNMADKPHALRTVSAPQGLFPNTSHSLSYSHFDKVCEIVDGGNSLNYTYGYNRQRILMEEHVGGTVRTKRYVGNCEYETETVGNATSSRWITYLSGPAGLFAAVETENNTRTTHYILKDNLGSWTTITDGNGTVEQRLSYDAWGNLRDPNTWSGSFTGTPMFDRGFTGHEHLYNFGLINMNGRMYDPVMSSFLSVDRYVQSPSNSQNFNRYAYCLNNPLRYTDPSGELLWEAVAAGAIIGSFSNATMQVMSGNVNNGAQFWVSAGIGAISGGLGGAAGYGTGYGMNVLLNGAEGFWLGCVAGATSGFSGSFVGASTAAWMQGASFSQGFWAGMKSGGWGALAGGLLGGLEAGYYAHQCGGNFWTGDNMVVAEHHSGDTYNGSKTKAKRNAIKYNNKSDYIDDVKSITNRINQEYNDWEYLVSGNIETRATEGYGMTDDLNSYVNIKNKNGNGFDIVDGYVAKRRSGFIFNNVKYDVHIAPGVASYDVTSFKAVVGHELIHSLHHNLFGSNFDLSQSERVAYRYTIDVYNNAGDYLRARQNIEFAIKKGYFSKFANPLYISPF